MDKKLHLVGSIPFDTVADVFEQFGTALGAHLHTMPDGEVGLRSHWISRVHYQVLALHPDIEVLRQPALEDGAERLNPRNAGDSWLFKLRAGAGPVQFGDPGWRLGFARDAVNSYFIFKTLREAGKLAPHLRFQVSMPSVTSALPGRIFEDASDAEKIKQLRVLLKLRKRAQKLGREIDGIKRTSDADKSAFESMRESAEIRAIGCGGNNGSSIRFALRRYEEKSDFEKFKSRFGSRR